MRHPFYMDHLDPEDQRTVKRWYVRIIVFYCSLALLSLAIGAMRINVPDSQIDAMRRARTTSMLQANRLVGASGAIAAEAAGSVQCALRDLRLVLSIEAHGEAQDVPADELRDAFFTMMKARAACAAGHADEALAIYDGIVIVPPRSAGK